MHAGEHFGARPLAPKLQNRNHELSLQSSLQHSGCLQTEAPVALVTKKRWLNLILHKRPRITLLLAPNLWLFQQLLRIFPLPLFVPEILRDLESDIFCVLIFLIISLRAAAGHAAVGREEV